jgi:hypothetical protein
VADRGRVFGEPHKGVEAVDKVGAAGEWQRPLSLVVCTYPAPWRPSQHRYGDNTSGVQGKGVLVLRDETESKFMGTHGFGAELGVSKA